MGKGIFITGTDTGVGKTLVTGLLGRYFLDSGISVVTQKWVQTGCAGISGDIDMHLKIMGVNGSEIKDHIKDISPYVLTYPASPHFASRMEGMDIDIKNIENSFRKLASNFDVVLAEGAGGVLVPVSGKTMMVDIARVIGLPVIIVAGNRLGAINQTLMTVEILRERNMPILGIVFNRMSWDGDETILADNMDIVEQVCGVNVLGELPCRESMEELYELFRPIGERIKEQVQV